MARKIVVDFVGNTRSLDNALDGTARRSGRFGDALRKAGRMAAVGLAVGAVAAGKALFDMTKAAIEDEKSQKLLATQLKNTAGATDSQIASVEKWIDSTARATGVADDELRPALAKLVTATGDVAKAQDLLSLAMDVSAGSGKSLDSVTTALQKAQNGSVGGLARLGIATKNAKGETKSFAELQDEMAKKFKGASATAAETMEGKMARLKVALSEAGEAIGYKLIPIVTRMAEWFLNKGLPAIQAFGGWLRDNLGPIFERIGEVVKRVFGGLNSDTSGNLAAIKSTINDFVSIVKSVWKLFGDDITRYAATAFEAIKQVISGALKIIQGIVKVFSSVLKGDWKGVWEGVKLILRGAWQVIQGIVKQALNILKTVVRVGFTAVKGIIGGIWDGIKQLIRRGATAVVDAVREIPGRLRDLGAKFKEAGASVIGKFVDGLKNAAGIVSGIAGNVWSAVKSLLNGAIDKINAALEFTINLPGPDVNINPPNIPHLAKGGVVSRPTLALIGEDGPEAVVPLGAKNRPKGGLGLGGGSPIIVHVTAGVGDPVAIGRELEKVLIQYTTRTGRPLQVATA